MSRSFGETVGMAVEQSERGGCIRSDRVRTGLRSMLRTGRKVVFGVAIAVSLSLCSAIIPATVFAEEGIDAPVEEMTDEDAEIVENDKNPVGTEKNESLAEPETTCCSPITTFEAKPQDLTTQDLTTQEELTSATVTYARGDQGTWEENTTTYTVNRSSDGTWEAVPAFPSDADHISNEAWNYGNPIGNDGYEFTGWAKGSDTSTLYKPEDVAASTPDAAAVTWVAQWKQVSINIDFTTSGVGVYMSGYDRGTHHVGDTHNEAISGNFSRGKDPSGTYTLNQTITMPVSENVFETDSDDPWKPYGWTNVKDGKDALLEGNRVYTVKEIVKTLGLTSMADLTLYPIFHEAELKIFYNADNPTLGTVSASQEEIGVVSQYSSNYTSGSVATGTTGIFKSWTLDKSKPATTYAVVNGNTITPDIGLIESKISAEDLADGQELNFFAMFEPPAYRVAYSAGTTPEGKAIVATVPSAKAAGYNTTTGFLKEKGTRTGYKFTNWYLDMQLTILASSADSAKGDPTYEQMSKRQTPVNNVITLYAGWEEVRVPYTVTWKLVDYLGNDVENGTVHTDTTRTAPLESTVQVTDDDINLVPLSDDERAKTCGYTYDEDLSTTSALLDSETGTYSLILAYKEMSDFSVTYDLTGGSGGELADGNPIKNKSGLRWLATHLNASTADGKIPVRAGYDFTGWYLTPTTDTNGQAIMPVTDCKTVFPTSASQYGPTYAELVNNDPGVKGILIYAGWNEQQAIISYSISDTAAGQLSNQQDKVFVATGTDDDVVGCTVNVTVAAGAGSKVTWTFKGWKQVLDDNTQVDVPEDWVTKTTDTNGNVTNTTIKPQKVKVNGATLYQSANYVAVFEKVAEEPKTPRNYVVVFDGNGPVSGIDQVKGATGTEGKQQMVEDVSAYLVANGFSRTGFTFNGWNTLKKPNAGEGAPYKDRESVVNMLGTEFQDGDSITLYAQWVEVQIQISYVTSGKGSLSRLSESVPVVYGMPKGCIASAATGYKFVGWTIAEALPSSSLSAMSLTAAGANDHNVIADSSNPTLTLRKGTSGLWVAETYVANFEPITYTLNYVANGGSGTMTSEKYTYEVPQTIKGNDFTRDGYAFAGWNTAADGSGSDVNTSYSVSKLTDVDGGSVTLYAQWQKLEKDDPKNDPEKDDPDPTTDPVEPTDPEDPEDPEEPEVNPKDEPADPDEPTDEPADPTDPEEPAEPTEPADPADPTEPEQHTDVTPEVEPAHENKNAVEPTKNPEATPIAETTIAAAAQEVRPAQAAAPGVLPQTGDPWSGSALCLLVLVAVALIDLGLTAVDLVDRRSSR